MHPIGPSDVPIGDIDIWVVSHGGVASNAICDHLESQGIRCRPANYGLICHKQHPGGKLGIPILVIHGDYLDAIKSMDRRKYLTANASKMLLGIDAPEIPLKRFLNSYPEDPIGFKVFLESFKDSEDEVYFLEYPYSNEQASIAFKELGLNVDLSNFALRERKRKWGRRTPEVQKILDVYSDFEFGG